MMNKTILLIILMSSMLCFSQNEVLNLIKTEESVFIMDGTLSEEELNNAFPIEIIYEHNPGYNTEPSYRTTGYVNYSEEFVYIAFKAYNHPRLDRSRQGIRLSRYLMWNIRKLAGHT